MAAYEQIGNVGSGTNGATPLVAHTGVRYVAGVLVACAAGTKAVGIVKNAAAANATGVAFTRCVPGEQLVLSTGGVLADDYLIWTAAGCLTFQAGGAGSTVLDANVVAQARTAPDANGRLWAYFF